MKWKTYGIKDDYKLNADEHLEGLYEKASQKESLYWQEFHL